MLVKLISIAILVLAIVSFIDKREVKIIIAKDKECFEKILTCEKTCEKDNKKYKEDKKFYKNLLLNKKHAD